MKRPHNLWSILYSIANVTSHMCVPSLCIRYMDERPNNSSITKTVLNGINHCRAEGFTVVHLGDTLARARTMNAARAAVLVHPEHYNRRHTSSPNEKTGSAVQLPPPLLRRHGERMVEARLAGCSVHSLSVEGGAVATLRHTGEGSSNATCTLRVGLDVEMSVNALSPKEVARKHGGRALWLELETIFAGLIH